MKFELYIIVCRGKHASVEANSIRRRKYRKFSVAWRIELMAQVALFVVLLFGAIFPGLGQAG